MSAGMFLCKATRFKLSFSTRGNVSCLQPYAKELEGRWVALVPADDDKHIGMAAERDRLKAANAELAEALEAVIKSRDNYHPSKIEKYCTDDLSGVEAHYWSPAASMVGSEFIALARAALTKHQKEQA